VLGAPLLVLEDESRPVFGTGAARARRPGGGAEKEGERNGA